MTEKQRLFLAAKGFNTNLVQCLPPYYVIISNVHLLFYIHNFPRAQSYNRKNMIYEGLL